jgi:hypothetical protein
MSFGADLSYRPGQSPAQGDGGRSDPSARVLSGELRRVHQYRRALWVSV